MADQQQPQPPKPAEGEQKRGFGRGGDRGGDRGGEKRGDKDRKPRDNRGKKPEENVWKPVTKLGRLVKANLIDNIVDIFRFAIPIK
jgi:small subunit ribosomal protein S2e